MLNQLAHQEKHMKLSTYKKSDIEEIKQLFSKVFSDSEGQAEGLLIGSLAFDLMKNTDSQDIYESRRISNSHLKLDSNGQLLSPTNYPGQLSRCNWLKSGIYNCGSLVYIINYCYHELI